MRMRLAHKKLVQILSKWHRYAQRRAGCRVGWDKRGNRMLMNKVHEKLYIHMNVWRYFAFCSKEMKRRTNLHFRDYVKDEEDRRLHAVKVNEEAVRVANRPRMVTEHTHVDNMEGGMSLSSSSSPSPGPGGKRKTLNKHDKKRHTKTNKKHAKEGRTR